MRSIIKYFWKDNAFVIFFMILAGISTTLVSFVNASILNALIQFDFEVFWHNIIKLIIIFSLFLIFTYLQIKQVSKTTQKMSNYLRFQVINKFDELSSEEFSKNNEGIYTSWLNNDINQIEQAGFNRFYEFLSNSINLVLALGSLFYIHWSLLLLTIFEIFIIIQLPKLLGKKIRTATLAITKANESSVSKTTNLLAGFSTFYLFNNIDYLIKALKKEYVSLAEEKNKQSFLMGKVAIIGGIGNVVGQISSYALSGFLALIGAISIGMITATVSLSATVFNTVGNLSQYLSSIQSIEPLIDKIAQFSKTSGKRPLQNSNSTKNLEQGIELKKISFGYKDKENIINNLNYEFEPNKKYAIEGKSGSGKSTILKLITKNLNPTEGKIYFNNTNIESIGEKDILNSITYIEQKPYVFNGTIRENINLGDNFTDSEIEEVLRYVGLDSFTKNLDSIISENGKNFSGGQLQRISLARGLVRKKSILLLDESTSSLDKEIALQIENLILDIADISVIMISHHLDPSIRKKLDGVLTL
ncbi:hypothetical protein RU97_GL001797 [Enterococcus canis]|uniref:ABC transporter ATP-binding protein n=1 Tax=Enterococcus canis TaxID=214095 RepID=A0A1L8RF45_9ENTE|nr:ABC transporter ATP-binding protein [Enterococcus canis]OJG18400.1 hypothetical protein RU97_GL001797 [Enterococcus canis]